MQVTLKGSGYDGADIRYSYNVTAPVLKNSAGGPAENIDDLNGESKALLKSFLENENGTGGFGKKELVYEHMGPVGDKDFEALLLRPIVLRKVDGVDRYIETANFQFTTKTKKVVKVKIGDVRKTFDAAGDYTEVPLEKSGAKLIPGGVHLSSTTPVILNKEKFDVVFDFLDNLDSTDPGIDDAVLNLLKINKGLDYLVKLPGGTAVYRLYRVILPIQDSASEAGLSLTGNYNVNAIGDPTLGYSALMNVRLDLKNIPLQTKRLVITAVEDYVETGGPVQNAQRTSYEFTRRVAYDGVSFEANEPGITKNGDGTFDWNDVGFAVVNRLRDLRFEVRAYLQDAEKDANPTLAAEQTASGNLAATAIATNLVTRTTSADKKSVLFAVNRPPVFSPRAGQVTLDAASGGLVSMINTAQVQSSGFLIYQTTENLSDESVEVSCVAKVVSFVPAATAGVPDTIGPTVDVKIPARLSKFELKRAKKVSPADPTSDYIFTRDGDEYVYQADEAASDFLKVVPGSQVFLKVKQDVTKNGTPAFQPVVETGNTSRVRVVTVAQFALSKGVFPYSEASAQLVASGGVEARVYGVGDKTKVKTKLKGFHPQTGSATVTIEECSEVPGADKCTPTGISFTSLNNSPSSVGPDGFASFGDSKGEIEIVGRGLGYAVRYQAWSEKNGQGVLLAERVVGRNNSKNPIKVLSLQDLIEDKAKGEFAAEDVRIQGLRIVPAGALSNNGTPGDGTDDFYPAYRGATVQVTPFVVLKDGDSDASNDVSVPISQAFVSYAVTVPNGQPINPTIDPGSGARNGQFEIGTLGSDQTKIFTVTGTINGLPGAVVSPATPTIKILPETTGDAIVTVVGFSSWPLDVRLTGAQKFTLEETTTSGSLRRLVDGPIFGFADGKQSGTFELDPKADFLYRGTYERLASFQSGLLLAEGKSDNLPGNGQNPILRTINTVTSKVQSLHVGMLSPSQSTPSTVLSNLTDLKLSATGRDGQSFVLSAVVAVSTSGGIKYVVIDPSMCRFEIIGGAPGHITGGNIFVVGTSPRTTQVTHEVKVTYYEVDGANKTTGTATAPNFRLTIPANRRPVEVIIK